MPRKPRKKVEIKERLLAEVPDLWDYVRENCMSLEAWKHEEAIAEFLTERVQVIIEQETSDIQAKMDRVLQRMDMLKEQLSKLRQENGDFKRERHRYAPQLEEIRSKYQQVTGYTVRDGQVIDPADNSVVRKYSSRMAEKAIKESGHGR